MSSNKSPFNNKYKQGYYKLINPNKYIGDPNNVKFRSSWEYAFCSYLDNNEKIIKWGIETLVIVYQDLRGKSHRYYPDFYFEQKTNDSNLMKKVVVEIKPKHELYPPTRPKNETAKALENYEYSIQMHVKNKLKWSKSESYCLSRGMEFVIITEEHLQKAGLLKS